MIIQKYELNTFYLNFSDYCYNLCHIYYSRR